MVVASDIGLNFYYFKKFRNIFGKVIMEGNNPVLVFFIILLGGRSIMYIDSLNW